MSSLQEKLERAKSVAVSSKHIGLTIALIGVLIAFCAAMVGSEQNRLTRTMTEQTQANSDYSGASTKLRVVMDDLENLRIRSSPESATAGPLPDLKRFLRLYLDYSRERDFAKKWADTYQPAIEAHFDAAEGYHNAQLFAEIGIVVASLAVLLSNRTAWVVSILLAVISIGVLTATFLKTRRTVSNGEDHSFFRTTRRDQNRLTKPDLWIKSWPQSRRRTKGLQWRTCNRRCYSLSRKSSLAPADHA